MSEMKEINMDARYKLAIADMLYEARRLPAGDYRKLVAIAQRVGIHWTGDPLDYARSPEPAKPDDSQGKE